MCRKKQVVMITKNFTLNGISTVISSYCDNLPSNEYAITILAGSKIANSYLEKYKNSNINIIECPSKDKEPIGYYKAVYRYLKNNPVDIVHIHGNSAVCIIELMIAYFCGVKKRIMHAHNTTCDNEGIHKFLKPFLNILCTDRCACGQDAGKWMYGSKKFIIIPNAFDVSHFSYNQNARGRIRKKLGLSDEILIGHIGLFNKQKNQQFLIKIFDEYLKQHPDAYLLLVGEGINFEAIKELAKKTINPEHIIFYGAVPDTAELYSAMDVFVLPSQFEGLPLVLLEAQISGLPCLVSDVITREAYLGGNVKWLSLQDEPSIWAACIDECPETEPERLNYISEHDKAISRYRIKNSINILKSIYEN